jgi:hypothetical protein
VQLEGFSPGAFLRPLLTDSHSPHACSTREYTPSLSHSPSAASPPSQGLSNRPDQNSQSSVAGAGLSLGENHFPTNSLTWRELLTGLTTCLFNHGPDNPLLQPVSTQFPQGEDNNHWSIQLRKTIRQASHTQSRNCVATTTHSYDTTRLRQIQGYSDFPGDTDQSIGFPTGFRVRDQETMQRSIILVSGSDCGWKNGQTPNTI